MESLAFPTYQIIVPTVTAIRDMKNNVIKKSMVIMKYNTVFEDAVLIWKSSKKEGKTDCLRKIRRMIIVKLKISGYRTTWVNFFIYVIRCSNILRQFSKLVNKLPFIRTKYK